ncbi:protein yellow [Zeugodacus cucurbitae]|uniref:Protein yellow n=1 Tax=Zeugodacus cucurbitae TaxID=28588 RepID=A0A0A1WP59_ZEUCU|nr:protein yellow [Zeugodacus cucurbitae]
MVAHLRFLIAVCLIALILTEIAATETRRYTPFPINTSIQSATAGNNGVKLLAGVQNIPSLIVTPTAPQIPLDYTQHKSRRFYENVPLPSGGDISAAFAGNDVVEPPTEADGSKPFQVVNEWKYLDFEYPTYAQRQRAIAKREFVPENNLPLGIDVYGERMFITTPRWKDGVPASLSYLPYPPKERSPALRPYPDWSAHSDVEQPDCAKLISVYRSSIDPCGRLWVIDSGIVNATNNLNQICQPKIVAFDLATDKMVVSFTLPPDQVKEDSLHSNILADVQDNQCEDAFVYVTDVWRFGIVVYSLSKNRSWRVTNYNFNPNPIASDFNVYGLNFQWLDGVFGMSLTPTTQTAHSSSERTLYFHPMASFKEFAVSTNLLRDEKLWPASAQRLSKYFVEVGDRGYLSQSSAAGIARNGVMFYTQVHRDNIGCWDTTKPYARGNLAMLLGRRQTLVQFPNDLTVDQEPEQSVWVMSNKLPIYLYGQLDYSKVNFRILRGGVDDIVRGTICDTQVQESLSNVPVLVQLQEGQCY